MRFFKVFTILFLLCFSYVQSENKWGFYAHQEINRLAMFTLPPEMFTWFKKNRQYLISTAVNPDKRRYIQKSEAARHYIDLDAYHDSIRFKMPITWNLAKLHFTEDTLLKHGIVPWHVQLLAYQLTESFKTGQVQKTLKIAAEIGHYIADANVPLHTTKNYNGQFTNQQGIHGFWESRLPELFSREYDFLAGRASYIENVPAEIWKRIYAAHSALDSVLKFEKTLSQSFPPDKKFSIETRNNSNIKVYSLEYSAKYHELLDGQVERQMLASVKLLGNIWYTCWINAGQPDLNNWTMDPQLAVIAAEDSLSSTGVDTDCNH